MAVPNDIPNRDQPIIDAKGNASYRMFAWMTFVQNLFRTGFNGTIVTAKLTGGGTNGSMTFTNGVLTSQTPAT